MLLYATLYVFIARQAMLFLCMKFDCCNHDCTAHICHASTLTSMYLLLLFFGYAECMLIFSIFYLQIRVALSY